jgi:hypothetical protein
VPTIRLNNSVHLPRLLASYLQVRNGEKSAEWWSIPAVCMMIHPYAEVLGNGDLFDGHSTLCLAGLALKAQLVSQQRRSIRGSEIRRHACPNLQGTWLHKCHNKKHTRKDANKTITTKKDIAGSFRKRRRAKNMRPLPPPKPLPPIVDLRDLADKVDSGRYLSVKRCKDDAHHKLCFLCKDRGALPCWDFCPKAVHI